MKTKDEKTEEKVSVPGARWKNRIVGYEDMDPEQLLANPLNFRSHSDRQKSAMRDVLVDVGVVQNVIVNQVTGRILDGHMRVGMAIDEKQPKVPVTLVRLTEEEERVVLATFDPLGELAGRSEDTFKALREGVDDSYQALIAATVPAEEIASFKTRKGGGGLGGKSVVQYNIIFDNEEQQREWFSFLRALKASDPELTTGARLAKYVKANMPKTAEAA
jgi:hypothetical protein